jgi:hypothetical protein
VSGRRGRPVRFPSAEGLPQPPAAVTSIGPVVFLLVFDGQARTIDLCDLPCPRLVRALAGALAGIGGQDGTVREWAGFARMLTHLRVFVLFAAAAVPAPGGDLGLEDVEPELLEAFETQVAAGYHRGSNQPHECMRTVVRLLRLAGHDTPGMLSIHMQARVGYASTTVAGPRPRPLDAYPLGVFEAVQAAALADVRLIRDRIAAGERLAASGADPRVAGWSQLENVLWHVAAHGPLTASEHSSIWAVDNTHGGPRAVNEHLFLRSADLVPLVVALIVATGLEPECVKGLRADCLVNPVAGFVSIAYVKKRARNNSHKTIRVRDGGGLHFPGGLIALARRLTARGRQVAGSDLLWTDVRDDGVHSSFGTGASFDRKVRQWADRHGLGELTDRGGEGVRLDLRRLRKTYKSRHYQRSAGVLDDFAQGHSKQVAARHYADIDAHRQLHEDAIEAGLRQALEVGLPPPVVADEHGRPLGPVAASLTAAQVEAAMSQQSDVFLASCTDFDASPFARTPGSGCPVAIWGCLECPNAVYTTRHLPSLLSFTGFLHAQREELPAVEWQARYGLAFERLTTGITPKFTPEQITTARMIVEGNDPVLSLPAHLLEHST